MIKEINTIKELLVLDGRDDREIAFQMFQVGAILNSPEFLAAKIKVNAVASTCNVQSVKLSVAKSMAKRFNNNVDDFMAYLDRFGFHGKWTKITQTVFAKQKTAKQIVKGIEGLSHHIVTLVNSMSELTDDEREEVYDKLRSVRKILDRRAPFVDQVSDQIFLRYNNCCCCGSYPPPPEGFHLNKYISIDGINVFYPVCPECLSNGINVDMKLVADLYIAYSLALEHAIDRVSGLV